jgi:uncharacterized membrane protein
VPKRAHQDAGPSASDAELPAHLQQTLAALADLHSRHQSRATRLDRVLQRLVTVVTRAPAMAVLIVLLSGWMGVNGFIGLVGGAPPDPAPFFWMDTAVAVCALFMTIVILTTQRRADELSNLRAQLTLELAILGERKSAKTIQLIEELRRDMPTIADRVDSEAEAMAMAADPQLVREAIEEAQAQIEAEGGQPEAVGPRP